MPRIFAQLLFARGKLRSHNSTSVVLTSGAYLPQRGILHLFVRFATFLLAEDKRFASYCQR